MGSARGDLYSHVTGKGGGGWITTVSSDTAATWPNVMSVWSTDFNRERVRAASAYSPDGRTILPRLAYTFTSERTPRLGLPHTLPHADVNPP
ncbi:hypothetical protein V9T40_006450 [Parthenolecanium corni]|uniref:Uncharacterized protein n=1 Tax=Parthenolecanium corni TaxID=536013 RepID=A0AAN9TXS6_9HEMI